MPLSVTFGDQMLPVAEYVSASTIKVQLPVPSLGNATTFTQYSRIGITVGLGTSTEQTLLLDTPVCLICLNRVPTPAVCLIRVPIFLLPAVHIRALPTHEPKRAQHRMR